MTLRRQRRDILRSRAPAAAATVVLVAGCTGAEPPTSPSGEASSPGATTASSMRLLPDCPRAPRSHTHDSAGQLNKLMAATDLPAWEAADIGATARLSDGRLVWLFGDTVRSEDLSPRIVANSMLVSSGRCFAQVRPPDDGPVIPDVKEGTVRWPMSVVVLRAAKRDYIVVMCSRIRRGSGGAFDFTFLGTSAAVFTVTPHGVPTLEKVVDITPDSTDTQQVNWGSAATVSGEWLYVYGTRLTGQKDVFGRELHVARAPTSSPDDEKQWRFWNGRRWHHDANEAAVILPATHGVSQVLSVDTIGDDYVAVSKRDGDIGNFVYKWTAPDPWGPWTPMEEFRAPGGFDTGKLEYAPLAHPEVPLTSGDLLVSVSRNTTSLEKLFADPGRDRPFFVDVPR